MGKISLPIDVALCGAIWTIVYLGIELFLCPIVGGLLGGTGKSLLLSLLHICGVYNSCSFEDREPPPQFLFSAFCCWRHGCGNI